MQRGWTNFGLGFAVLALACAPGRAASTASIAGTVRNSDGAAQVGAMVQVLDSGASTVATAFTDIYGRYRIAGLAAGNYRVRASAATFIPATRWNLHLASGMRATVNLTMNMLADPAIWLPAERRLPGEPGDDWTWTLRSAPDRPILRVLDDGAATGDDRGQLPAAVHAEAAVLGGDADFGDGGVHNVIALDRISAGGSDIVLQADLGAPQAGASAGPSSEVTAGYERKGLLGDASRIAMTYASHPELQSSDGSGMQWMRMASAEKMQLGDLAELEAGSTVYAIHAGGYALSTQPFLRVTLHPGQVWAVRYRLATARDLRGGMQSFDGLDPLTESTPVAAMRNGRLAVESGLHQELAVTRKAGNGMVRVAVYRDAMTAPAVGGGGARTITELAQTSAVLDASTGSFEMLGPGYSAKGVSVAVAGPLGGGLWGSLEYSSGAGLDASASDQQTLAADASVLHPVGASSAAAALDGKVQCIHTKLRVSYRWQPTRVVTPVNAYAADAGQAYLGFVVHQAISLGSLLPQGLEATVDVTNLLAQGYHPFLSADGRTLYLAQAPRSVRAGLAFNF